MKLDVRCKIIIFLAVSITSFMTKDVICQSIIFGVVFLLICLMGQVKIAVSYTVVYGLVIILIMFGGLMPAVIRSLVLMMALCIRMFLPVLLYARGFAVTTPVSEMITGMYLLRMPQSFVITFAVAMRFFPTAKEELRNIKDAMRLRGMAFSFSRIIRHPRILLEGFFIPMMMRACVISEELAAAAITRGLDSPEPRTSFYKLKLSVGDVIIGVLFTAALGGVMAVKQWIKGGAV